MIDTLAHLIVAPLLTTLSLWTSPVVGQDDAVWPLDPRPEVVEGFAPPVQEWGAGHRGVDLRGSPGQPVRASLQGTVTFAGRLAGRGVVVVGHGDTRTTYQPVSATVAVGERVGVGERIGTLEIFGSHCWPATCLHWGLIDGGTYLNPLTLVGAGQVRLLPLLADRPVSVAPGPARSPRAQLFRPGDAPGGTPAVVGQW